MIRNIIDIIKQTFCKHEYVEYNNIKRVDGKNIERWLICRKCSHHKFLTIWRDRKNETPKPHPATKAD